MIASYKPTNEANWQLDVAQLAWAEMNGDDVTLHNVRNCDYRSETDYTPHWEPRTVRLSQIAGIDLAPAFLTSTEHSLLPCEPRDGGRS